MPHIDLRWITTQLELTRSTSCADTAKSFLRRTVDGIATMFARQECTLIVDGSRKRSYIFQRMEYDHGTRIAVRHGWVDVIGPTVWPVSMPDEIDSMTFRFKEQQK